MSGMSFGDGADARHRIGNVFLAFTEVKRGRFRSPEDHAKRFQSVTGIVSDRAWETSPAEIDLYFSRLLI